MSIVDPDPNYVIKDGVQQCNLRDLLKSVADLQSLIYVINNDYHTLLSIW